MPVGFRVAIAMAWSVCVLSAFGLGLVMGSGAAMAADGDACFISGSDYVPGEEQSGVCEPLTTPPVQGQSCAGGLFYNEDAGMCVANNASCETGGQPGSYTGGQCNAFPEAPAPTPPTSPVGFSVNPAAGQNPSGTQQPMCVNASPFIGGGAFIVTGAVLCYGTADGKGTNMFAYTDGSSNSGGWNPFNGDTWDSLNLKDLFAQDDITALGTLSVYGGAQLFSANGQNGIQVDDEKVLLGAYDGTNSASMTIDTSGLVLSAKNGTDPSSSLSVTGVGGIDLVGNAATGGPGVSIGGAVGSTSTAGIGVVMRGDGQGAIAAPTSGPAAWADVLLASKSFTGGVGPGSGIVINDYGVVVRSASTGNSYNEFGSGAGNAAGSTLVNVIGDGGAGSVANYLGRAGQAGTTVVNEIGTAGGSGATTNRIGNANAATTIEGQAGSTSMVLINGALDLVTGQGASILPTPTQQVSGGTATAMLGSTARHAVVGDNGRITVVNGVAAPEATSSMYIVNGRGTANGVVATERTAVVAGGNETPTAATFSDTGMHLSNTTNGAPVTVSGVADGAGAFDAVNVRQLDSGLASVAALTGLPGVQPGKRSSVGMAVGHHGSGVAFALGGESLFGTAGTVKYGAAVSHASGRVDTSASFGLGFSW